MTLPSIPRNALGGFVAGIMLCGGVTITIAVRYFSNSEAEAQALRLLVDTHSGDIATIDKQQSILLERLDNLIREVREFRQEFKNEVERIRK